MTRHLPRPPIKVGDRFGDLVVIEKGERHPPHTKYKCRCACGLTSKVWGTNLNSGRSRRCPSCKHLYSKLAQPFSGIPIETGLPFQRYKYKPYGGHRDPRGPTE